MNELEKIMNRTIRSLGHSAMPAVAALRAMPFNRCSAQSTAAETAAPPPPVALTSQQDHQRIMELLHITALRPGANGSNRLAPNYANYDEAKANPYPELPDPLVLKNKRKVTSAKIWWSKRRPEIVEDFDSEVYGRAPKNAEGDLGGHQHKERDQGKYPGRHPAA